MTEFERRIFDGNPEQIRFTSNVVENCNYDDDTSTYNVGLTVEPPMPKNEIIDFAQFGIEDPNIEKLVFVESDRDTTNLELVGDVDLDRAFEVIAEFEAALVAKRGVTDVIREHSTETIVTLDGNKSSYYDFFEERPPISTIQALASKNLVQ